MYIRPGVYIYQQYESRPTSTTARPNFAPAVIGVCTPVVEGPRAYAGRFDTSTSAQRITFTYPQMDQLFDNIMISTAKIFLVPSGGTEQVRIESLTRDYLRRFGIRRDYVGPVADITEAVRKYTWVDSQNQQRAGIENTSVTIPTTFNTSDVITYNGFQFGTDGRPIYPMCDVYIEYRAYRAPKVSWVTETFTGTGRTIFELMHPPIETAMVYLVQGQNQTDVTSQCTIDKQSGIIVYPSGLPAGASLKVLYTALNKLYLNRTLVRSLDDIVSRFGSPHPLNPVALGAYLALSNANSPIYAIAVQPTIVGSNNIDTMSLDTALTKMGTTDIYAIAVMDTAKRISSIVTSFVDAYSDPSKSNLKIAMLGFESHTDIVGQNITPLMFKNELIRFAYQFDNPRIRLLANPFVDINLFGTVMPVAGYFYSAIYAGQVCALMNSIPSRPLTNTVAPVSGERFLPTGEQLFSENDLDEIATNGYWILVEDGDRTYVRHQLTTAEKDYAQREDSIIRAVDYFSLNLKAVLRQVVGVNALTRTFINDTLVPIVNEQIKDAVRRGIAGENTSITDITIESPDTVRITIAFEPPFPANVIKIIVVV